MAAHPLERDWMVVAPWWRWTDPAGVPPGQAVRPDPLQGRLSLPVFQKYDSPKLVNDFIANPQHCLQFNGDDLVQRVVDLPPPHRSPSGKWLRMGAEQRADGSVQDQTTAVDAYNTRKIFLSSHKRHYLVVCQVNCDGPGFPKAAPEKVCETGFVVRRRTTTAPSIDPSEIEPVLKKLAATRLRIARVNQLSQIETRALAAATGAGGVASSAKLDSLLQARASLQAVLADDKARFDAWAARVGLGWQLQGWFPQAGAGDKIGGWAPVEESPLEPGTESSFPLYPLKPDPNDPNHSGQGGTVFFGLLPTLTHDTDASGRPRLDADETYEVRCWVKRHKVPHDRDQPCTCPDGYFWSRPSEPFKLASHFDLTGTAHQPVTIQMPNLADLAAQARPAFGAGFAKPKGSLMFSVDGDGKPQKQGSGRSTLPEICFIPIPLITIVATFVLELFLPIVMLLFQLWWMLALRFCIPPQFSVSAGIKAELGASGSFGVNASGSVSASVDAQVGADMLAAFGPDAGAALNATYAPVALANMEVATNAADGSMPGVAVPRLDAGLAWEPEVRLA